MDLESLFLPPYDIFTIVTLFTLALSGLEIFFVLFGFSFSKFFGVDHDFDLHLDSKNALEFHYDPLENINLFNLGQVPFLVLLLSLTGFFSFFGFGIHILSRDMGLVLNNLLVVPLSVGLSSFFTYGVAKWWKRVFPNIETYAVSKRSFVGRVGTVNLGTVTKENAVEIAIYDQHKAKHYIMASVAMPDVSIEQNGKVIVVHKKSNGTYLVLPFLEKETKLEMNASKSASSI